MNLNLSRLALALGGVVVFGAVSASAATLGGAESASVGSNDAVVAACDSDGVKLSYAHSYDQAAAKYVVSSVTVSDVAEACAGQTAAVTVRGTGGAVAGSGSATVAGTSVSFDLASPVAAQDVSGVSVIISG